MRSLLTLLLIAAFGISVGCSNSTPTTPAAPNPSTPATTDPPATT